MIEMRWSKDKAEMEQSIIKYEWSNDGDELE